MFRPSCVLVVLLLVVAFSSNQEELVLTHEWQVVQSGQVIPTKSHIRFDLKSGQTLAKLADRNDDNKNYGVVLVQNPKINTEGLSSSDEKLDSHKMSVKLDTSRNFKPYSELKKDYDEIVKAARSESALLIKLFDDFEKSKSDEDSLPILEQMEDLLRKFDNAVDFARIGKLAILMNKLPIVSSVVKARILSCLAAALQSNPLVKAEMYKAGLLNKLVQLWHQELLLPKIDSSVIGQCLLATSVLIRNFPVAQKNLFGPRVDEYTPVGYNLLKRTLVFAPDNTKIKTRIFSLLGDLLEEYNSTEMADNSTNSSQYELIKLADNLPKYGFCHAAVRSLFDQGLLKSNSYRQRTMAAVTLISNVCDQHQLYPNDEAMEQVQTELLLGQWRAEFTHEREKEQNDESESNGDYYDEMLKLLNGLQDSLLRFYPH
nr:nucleotide exchange factor SIL1 [Hymenolepis microstoma]